LTDEYGAKQSGMQIHEDRIRIDVKCELDLTKIPKEEFEKKVNVVIKRNLLVIKTIFKREEVPDHIDISMIPEHVKKVRIVSIGDFDNQPCVNPHVENTSEIGEYEILKIFKKGKKTYRFVGTVRNK
jgi:alanyl-tRNA synthetase/misacylated tRNA(Ala) deacylase